jgi:hypothetical protein
MAFKTPAAFVRHVKFSSLHEELAKRLLEAEMTASLRPEEVVRLVQVEGIHFKLLYAGRKLFWRSQLSVDLNVYVHMGCSCIEIIGALSDSLPHELNRLYMSYDTIMHVVKDIFNKTTFDDNHHQVVIMMHSA